MQNLPLPKVYEQELRFTPWGLLVREVQAYLQKNVPENGSVLDLMSGTGYLMGNLKKVRPDLDCAGAEGDPMYLAYAWSSYPGINFWPATMPGAIRSYDRGMYDAVVCTGGVHHIEQSLQDRFIFDMMQLIKPGGFVIIGDPYIADFDSEQGRMLASSQLGYEYLNTTIRSGAPIEVIKAALQVLSNDVFAVEWKTSIMKRTQMFRSHPMWQVDMHKTWPPQEGAGYGDFYFIIRKK